MNKLIMMGVYCTAITTLILTSCAAEGGGGGDSNTPGNTDPCPNPVNTYFQITPAQTTGIDVCGNTITFDTSFIVPGASLATTDIPSDNNATKAFEVSFKDTSVKEGYIFFASEGTEPGEVVVPTADVFAWGINSINISSITIISASDAQIQLGCVRDNPNTTCYVFDGGPDDTADKVLNFTGGQKINSLVGFGAATVTELTAPAKIDDLADINDGLTAVQSAAIVGADGVKSGQDTITFKGSITIKN